MTKRQLGFIFILAGVAAILGMFARDLLAVGVFQGVGPTQKLAILVAGATILVGLSLLPMGDKPA